MRSYSHNGGDGYFFGTYYDREFVIFSQQGVIEVTTHGMANLMRLEHPIYGGKVFFIHDGRRVDRAFDGIATPGEEKESQILPYGLLEWDRLRRNGVQTCTVISICYQHWVIMIVCLCPLFFMAAIRLRLRHRRLYRHRHGLCPSCGYDMRASSERCPECGVTRLGTKTNGS